MSDDRFKQPEIPGRNFRDISVPEPLAFVLREDYLSDSSDSYPLSYGPRSITDDLARGLERGQELIATSSTEHLFLFEENGSIRKRFLGSESSVSAAAEDCMGGIALHNHPANGPPSFQDVLTVVALEMRQSRVVTRGEWIYDLSSGPNRDMGDLRASFLYLDECSWAVAHDVARGLGVHYPEEEFFRRRNHAILMELARRGFVCYARDRWKITPTSSESEEC